MMTKTEQDRWVARATIEALKVVQDECLMIAQEASGRGHTESSECFFALHDNIKHRIEDVEDSIDGS